MLRQLPPYRANLTKRLVKAPKVYIRDSGLLHSLLGIEHMDALLGHPIAGSEIDLVLESASGRKPLAFEIKRSVDPKPSIGFWTALTDLGAQGHVIAPVKQSFPLKEGVWVHPVTDLPKLLVRALRMGGLTGITGCRSKPISRSVL